MRILLTIKNFDFGGAENHVCELANALHEQGHDVFVVGKQGRQSQRLNPNVTFLPLPLHSCYILANLIQLMNVLRTHHIQLIHAHQRYAIHLSSIAGLITGIPIVVTVHGRSQYDLRSLVARRVSRKIIFVSDYVLKHSNRFPGIQKKTVWISNGIEFPKAPPVRIENRICYVSRMDSSHANLLHMLLQTVLPKLLEANPNMTFHILGEGKAFPDIQLSARQLNTSLGRAVCFVHGFRPEVTAVLMQSALVMGVGRVALEALSCGTPVLCVNKKRMGTLISTENYSFYKANNFVAVDQPSPDAERLHDQLTDYLSRPSYWLEEASRLQNWVRSDFSWKKTTESILQVYREVLQSS